MIEINLLRENPALIKASQVARGADVGLVDLAADLAEQKKLALQQFETLRAKQNAHGKLVAQAPKEEKAALVAQAQELSADVKKQEAAANLAEQELMVVLHKIENIVLDGVPAGGEENFQVIKEVGSKPAFAFEPKDHVALGESLDIIDIERGAKIAGSRFYFLKGASHTMAWCWDSGALASSFGLTRWK